MLPNGCLRKQPRHGVQLSASMQVKELPQQPSSKTWEWRDFTLAAAQGKLFTLSGAAYWEQDTGTSFEVYKPDIGTWFTAASPIDPTASNLDFSVHSLVANQQDGMLLLLGGANLHRATANPPGRHVRMYDISSGKWEDKVTHAAYGGGVTWPNRHQQIVSWSTAAAVDPFTIMAVVSSSGATEAMVDLLDLRMWKWRAGKPLVREDKRLQANRVVNFKGCVLVVGERKGLETDSPLLNVTKGTAGAAVDAYDVKTDSWCALQPLPWPVCCASPVVVRMPNALRL